MAGPESVESTKALKPASAWSDALAIVRRERADRLASTLTGGYSPSPEYRGLNSGLKTEIEGYLNGQILKSMEAEFGPGRP